MSKKLLRDFLILTTLLALLAPAAVSAGSMAETSLAFDGRWKGMIVCADKNGDFSSDRRARIENGVISYSKGVENKDRFEIWHGIVGVDQEVFILGRYFWKSEKHLWLRGKVSEDGRGAIIYAEGKRGPKSCNLKLTRVSLKP